MADWIDQISELRRLKNEGALSDDEFETHRRAIMARRSSATTLEADQPAQNVESQSREHRQDIAPSTGADSIAMESGANGHSFEMKAGTKNGPYHESRGAAEASSKSSPHPSRVYFTQLSPRLMLLSGSVVVALSAAAFTYRFLGDPLKVTVRSSDAAAQSDGSSTRPATGATAQVGPTPAQDGPQEQPISQAAKSAQSPNTPTNERKNSANNTVVGRPSPNVAADMVEGDNPGLQAMRQGDLNSAIQFFTNVIENGQLSRWDLKSAYIARGNAYLRKNEPDHARRDADAALSIDPSAEDARKLWYATTANAAPPDSNIGDRSTVTWRCNFANNPNIPYHIIVMIDLENKTMKSPNFGEVGRKLLIKVIDSTASWNFHIEGASANGTPWHSDGVEMLNLNSGILNSYVHNSLGGNTHQIWQCSSQ